MAKIVPFPQDSADNLDDVEKLIRKWLTEVSVDTQLIETVTHRMMFFISEYAFESFEPIFNLVVPASLSQAEAEILLHSINNGTDKLGEKVQLMINRIIVERFFIEIEIYKNSKQESPLCLKCPNFRKGRSAYKKTK